MGDVRVHQETDRHYASLRKNDATGEFDPDIGKPWPDGLKAPVECLDILS
jgi:hypothetical protein